MGDRVTLTASDGHKFKAWRSAPDGKPRGGLLVIQEIYGVNAHIRSVTDRFANLGYLSISPALFDRKERDFAVDPSPETNERGRALNQSLDDKETLLDLEAARQAVASAGKVGIVGYCFGGLVSYLAACRGKFDAASAYYGRVGKYKSETPRCPVIVHFGDKDHLISAADVEEFRKAQPKLPVYVYDAPHGFNRDGHPAYVKAAADLAQERTLKLFAEHIG